MRIHVTIRGDREVERKLRRLGDELFRLDRAMERIGKELRDYYANQAFTSQGGVFGERWPRLLANTAKYKARRYAGRPPLIRTGNMQRGFAYHAQSRSVEVYNRQKYFEYQNSGTRRGLPARRMIGINREVEDMVKSLIQQDIDRKIRTA